MNAKRLLRWLNRKLNIVETDDDANAYYAWADERLDQMAAEARLGVKCDDCGCTNRHNLDIEH